VLAVALGLAVAVGAAELVVRLVVPDETFWPIHSVYARSELPGVGYTFRPDFSGFAFGVPLRTNGLGFRGPDWEREPVPGTLRIALVGDSIAFGYGVRFEDTVGEVLARLLAARHQREVEVLNFGVNGYNAAQQRAVVEALVLDHRPDILVVLTTSNDHDPALRVDGEGYLRVGEGVVADGSIDLLARDALGRASAHSRLLLYLRLLVQRAAFHREAQLQRPAGAAIEADWMAPLEPAPIYPWLEETVVRALSGLVAAAAERGVPVVLAGFVDVIDNRVMLAEFDREGVPSLNLLELFPEARSWSGFAHQFGLGWDPHPNAVAHRRFAAGIAERIERAGLLEREAR